MNPKLKQFLHDQKRFKRGLPPSPLPFSRNPRPPVDTEPVVGKKACPERPRRLRPSKLRRHTAYMARYGRVFTPEPPTREQRYKCLPQLCRECNNGKAGRLLLPPAAGSFFKDHKGHRGIHLRWICHRCTGKHGESTTSPGENRLHELLKESGIPHRRQKVFEGKQFDFFLPKSNLIVEVDSWSAHHTASQKKKDYHRNKTADRLHIHLLRVQWDDPDMLVKVLRARQRGQALRRRSKWVQSRKPPRAPCTAWATSV